MNKKILISLSVIGVVAAIAFGGTIAYFNDTETSSGNTFTAGILDLKIDNTSYYNGELNTETTWTYEKPIGLFFNFKDMKPGDWGEDTISVRVETNDAWACMDFYLYNANDNGLIEPEQEDGDKTDGPGRGELQNEINFVWWVDDRDNVLEEDEVVKIFWQGSLAQLNASSVALADSKNGILNGGPLEGNETYYIAKAWCFGNLTLAPVAQDQGSPTTNPGFNCSAAGLNNITQSDSVQGTLSFRAIQSQNNNNFVCESLCSVISFVQPLSGVDSDTSGWSNSDTTKNLGTNTWSLLGGTADVYGYKNGSNQNLTHRGTRGLGVAGQEDDEVDSLNRPEKIEIVFDNPVLMNSFEVRSLFANESGKDEEGDVELYNGPTLVQSYHLTANQTGGSGSLETLGSNQAINKIVFYVDETKPYSSYSEFAVSKVRVCPVPTK